MNDEIEYLEKYSVAPSPSRDYYGLKIIRDKVILYIWKISHGPHKTPLLRTSNFEDFERDKQLQEEIQRAFGKYLLIHVKNVASRSRQTLLTLPKNVIARLVNYLTVNDVVNLTALSHVAKEIFDENFVWEILCKRYTSLTKRNDKLSTNWKQLFQLAHIQGLMKEHKETRSRQPPRQTSATKPSTKHENSLKLPTAPSRSTSRPLSTSNQTVKKPSSNLPKKPVQNSIPRKPSSHNFPKPTIETHVHPQNKIPPLKSLQTNDRNVPKAAQSSTKILTQSTPNREINKSLSNKVDSRSDKKQMKPQRSDTKVSSAGSRAMEDRSNYDKPKRSTHASSAGSEKCSSMQSAGVKSKKTGKKIRQSKSTNLSTTEDPITDQCATRDDSFDFADLIEASLKNIRSPMSMFDCNPIPIDRKSCGGDVKVDKTCVDRPRILKSGNRKTLDRLSEKSEPLTAKSVVSDVSSCSGKVKMAEKAKTSSKSMKSGKRIEKSEEDMFDYLGRYGIYKEKMQVLNVEECQTKNRKKLLDKMTILRSLGSSSGGSLDENDFGRASSPYGFRKRIGNLNKH